MKAERDIRTAFSREGYYVRRAARNGAIWFWSGALALLCTLISYPGIWYSDSYVRVATSGAVLHAMVNTLKGMRMPVDTNNAFTIIPSFFMALSRGLTGHVALYTFGQAFAFFAVTFLLIRELNPAHRRLQSVLFACCPLIYGMSVYYEAGIGCLTGMAALMLLFWHAGDEKSRGDRILEGLLVAFSSFVCFGYRTNALTILPVLGFALFRCDLRKVRKALFALALLMGLLMTRAVPWIFDLHSQTTASVGIVWEMLTAIQRMPEEEREEYRDYLDEIGGEGATQAALEESNEYTAGSFMWGDHLGTGQLSAPGATMTAVRKYLQLMVEKPGIWWGVKWDVMMRSLGIQGLLDDSEYSYDRWDRMAEFGMNDSSQRKAFFDSVIATIRGLGPYTQHPWLTFLISVLLAAAEHFRKGALRRKNALVLAMAAFYYLAYLLDTPAYDFRYFYPSLYLLMTLDAVILLNGAGNLIRKIGAGHGGKKKPA